MYGNTTFDHIDRLTVPVGEYGYMGNQICAALKNTDSLVFSTMVVSATEKQIAFSVKSVDDIDAIFAIYGHGNGFHNIKHFVFFDITEETFDASSLSFPKCYELAFLECKMERITVRSEERRVGKEC